MLFAIFLRKQLTKKLPLYSGTVVENESLEKPAFSYGFLGLFWVSSHEEEWLPFSGTGVLFLKVTRVQSFNGFASSTPPPPLLSSSSSSSSRICTTSPNVYSAFL